MNKKTWQKLPKNRRVDLGDKIKFDPPPPGVPQTDLIVLALNEKMCTGIPTMMAKAEPAFTEACPMCKAGFCNFNWQSDYNLDFCSIQKKRGTK